MRFFSFILTWLFLSISSPLAGQVMQFRDNEDLAIYGDDITEFTWVRGQYTNHRGGQYGFRRDDLLAPPRPRYLPTTSGASDYLSFAV